jgi:hypothetical protein
MSKSGFSGRGPYGEMHRKAERAKEAFSANCQHLDMSEPGKWELYQLLRLR